MCPLYLRLAPRSGQDPLGAGPRCIFFLASALFASRTLTFLASVFAIGHLGEATVEHAAHHLPVIVQELLEQRARTHGPASLRDTAAVSEILKRAFVSFDRAIASDVLDLIPGGLDGLASVSDEHIRSVINDHGNGLKNYRKVQLNMYGTTALLALVDPSQSNLWIANLGDCQAGVSRVCFHVPLRRRVSVQNIDGYLFLLSACLEDIYGEVGWQPPHQHTQRYESRRDCSCSARAS